MGYHTASNYSIMLFFLVSRFQPCDWRVNGILSALSCVIASSSLYNICPQCVLMAYLELFLFLGIVWCSNIFHSPMQLRCQCSSGGRRAWDGNAGSPCCFMDLAGIGGISQDPAHGVTWDISFLRNRKILFAVVCKKNWKSGAKCNSPCQKLKSNHTFPFKA